MNEEYVLDQGIEDYLIESVSDTRRDMYTNILKTIHDLNYTDFIMSNDLVHDLTTVESDIRDIIYKEDEEVTTKLDKIDNYFKIMLNQYLRKYYILTYDTTPINISYKIMLTLLHLITTDVTLQDFTASMLEGDEDEVTKLHAVMSLYTEQNIFDLYDNVEDMSLDIFISITQYLEDQREDDEIDTYITNSINKLNRTQPELIKTVVVRDLFKTGSVEEEIDDYIDKLHLTLDKYKKDLQYDKIAYEIVATFYLINGSENMMEGIGNYFDFTNMLTSDDEIKIDINDEIYTKVQKLTSKLEG